MWHVIYLSVLNVFIGVTSSVIVRRRAQWVRRQTELGYDFETLFPPKFFGFLPFKRSKPVDVPELCKAIDPDFQFDRSVLSAGDIEFSELEVDPGLTEASSDPVANVAEDSGSTIEHANSDEEEKPSGPESTMEVIDLQEASQNSFDDEEDDEVESSTSNETKTNSDSEAPLGENASIAVESVDSVSTDGAESQELESIRHKPQAVDSLEARQIDSSANPAAAEDADPEPTASNQESEAEEDEEQPDLPFFGKPEKEAEAKEDDGLEENVESSQGDFLQRMSTIEGTLQSLLDDSSGAQSIILPSQQVLDTADYWEKFQTSTRSVLEIQKQRTSNSVVIDSIDSVLKQVQEQVSECQTLAAKAVQGKELGTTKDTGQELRTHVLAAAKSSHLLRDELATNVAHASLRFGNCTPEGLQDYFEGLNGLEMVIQEWKQRETGGFAGLGLIDIDQFDQINRDFGLAMSDIVLARCCQQINTSIRHNRGFDRLVRVGGQQFLIFFGYTSAADACYALERIRQSFVQTDFEIQGELTHVDIRAAAIDFAANQFPIAHLQKLREGVAKAKELGGNNIVCGSFEDPFYLVEGLPEYELPIRSIEIDDSAVLSG